MSAEEIDNSDAKQLKDLYDSLYSLIVYCGRPWCGQIKKG